MPEDASRRGLAELLGSFALTFVGGAVLLHGAGDLVAVAAAYGLTLAIFVSAFGHVSGGHFNPVVTLAFLVTRRITQDLAWTYWTCQFAGGLLAALMLRIVYDDRVADGGDLAAPRLADGVAGWEGLILEIVLTFLFVLIVFAASVDPRGGFRYVAGLGVGLAYGVCLLVGLPLTGGVLNPQRALGPELLSWTWADAWVYYLGPPIGACAAALVYDAVYLRRQADAAAPRAQEAGVSSTTDPVTPPSDS